MVQTLLNKALIGDLQNLFQRGGFQLRKWTSNESLSIENLPDSLKASCLMHSFNPDQSHRILGLQWNSETDSPRVQVVEKAIVNTKRQLLHIIAHNFNPLCLLLPSTAILKILLQDV